MTAEVEIVDGPKGLTDRRIGTAEGAKTMYDKMVTANGPRRRRMSQLLNQFNGGKPMNQKLLDDKGQSWRANLNFRDASSTLEKVQVAYWRLLHDSANLCSITLHSDNAKADSHAKIMEAAFNQFHEEWGPGYVLNYLLFSLNHLLHGKGLAYFRELNSPRWTAAQATEVLLPEDTPADVEKFECIAIEQKHTLEFLWKLIRDESARNTSKQLGWNVSQVKKLIHKVMREETGGQSEEDWVEIENRLRNNSLGESNVFPAIKVVWFLTMEHDGKIAKTIFDPNGDGQEFLYDDFGKNHRYDSMRECLSCVFFEVGNGQYHSVQGFGEKNYALASATNRLKSRALDRTMLDGMTFKDIQEGTRETLPITNIGPFTVLPNGLEHVQMHTSGQTVFEAIGMLENQSNWNNSQFKDGSQQIERSKTATQARILANLQSQVDVANSTLYLMQIGWTLFSETLRRLRKEGSRDPDAERFQKYCIDNGVPEEILYNAKASTKTGADPRAASAALQAEIARELMMQRGNRHVNDRAVTEAFVSNTAGADAVKKLLHPEDQLEDRGSIRLAMLENTSLGDGVPIPADAGDNHPVHIEGHLTPLQAMVDQFQDTGQINPDNIIALQTTIPHVSEHFEYLKQDEQMKEVYQMLWPKFTSIVSMAESMESTMANQINQLEQNSPLPPENENPQLNPPLPGQGQGAFGQIAGAGAPPQAPGDQSIPAGAAPSNNPGIPAGPPGPS